MDPKKIKELNEQRGAKYKDFVALSDKDNLTADEKTKFGTLESEIRGIDEQLTRAATALALASSKPIDLSVREERDIATFDIGKVLRSMAASLGGRAVALDGVEKEMVEEGDKEVREAQIGVSKGVTLPRVLCRRQDRGVRRGLREGRAMTATGTTSTTGDQGGMTVATTPLGLLDDFYNALVLEQAGITVLEGLRGNVNFPRFVKDSDPAHKTENASAGAYAGTTAMLSLSPKRLPVYQDISEQLLMQSPAAIETVIRNNLTAQLAAEIENMFLNGSGGSGQPAGILDASAYTLSTVYAGGASVVGTNADGAAQVYRDWTRLRTAVAKNNALRGRCAFVTNSQVVGQAFETKRGLITPSDTNPTDSRMIIDDAETMRVAGFPVFETNSCPATLTKGASSGILSANVFANWQDYYAGFWSGINLELLRDATIGIQGLYRLALAVYYDGGIVRPKSFAKCIDINAP